MTQPYHVEFSRHARSYFRRQDRQTQARLGAEIDRIAEDPHREEYRELAGKPAGWRRARVGSYRIVFAVEDTVRIVEIVRIGPRGDVYKDL